MVTGLDKFRKAFEEHDNQYIIIGGTACDILLSGGGLIPRGTKDIDIILVIESLNAEFVKQLWRFLDEGKYQSLEKEPEQRKYYRFSNPTESGYPRQIELFSRTQDALDEANSSRFTHIKIEEGIKSLSAILMDESYYRYTVERCSMVEGVRVANIESVICLKAKAFLDLEQRKKSNEQVDQYDITKHKNDIFRMAAMLTTESYFQLPDSLRSDMRQFLDGIKDHIPSDDIMKRLGAVGIKTKDIYAQLYQNFELRN